MWELSGSGSPRHGSALKPTRPNPQHPPPNHPPPVGDVHEQWSAAADGAALRALGADHCIFVGDIGNRANVQLVQSIAELDHPKSVILGNHGTITIYYASWCCSGSRLSGPPPFVGWQTPSLTQSTLSLDHINPDAWGQLTAAPMSQHSKKSRVTAAAADDLRAAQLQSANSADAPADSGSGGNGSGAAAAAGSCSSGGTSTSSSGSGSESIPRSEVHQQLDALGRLHVGYRDMELEGTGVTIVGARPFSKVGDK